MARPKSERHHRDYILAGFALLVELVAVAYGEQWIGWGSVALFWLPVYSYAKPSLKHHPIVVVATLLLVAVGLFFGLGDSWCNCLFRLRSIFC
jgi:hypothetical protein